MHNTILRNLSTDVQSMIKLPELLDYHISSAPMKFKEEGPWIAVANHAALFEYGAPHSIFARGYKSRFSDEALEITETDPQLTRESLETIRHVSKLTFGLFLRILRRSKDMHIHNYLHVTLVFLSSLASVDEAMKLVESDIPWKALAEYLNMLAGSKGDTLLYDQSRPLPEDYVIRGQIWSVKNYPNDWFETNERPKLDEERSLDLPPMKVSRIARILTLSFDLASFGKWLIYDKDSNRFSTPYV
ncbi:MAG: hypothetical protein M1834_004242 [Cirrosporium novae-zelandiae]|nr:MAG: hypothetical protein M1834_004242 [Cirrosporium novae-zelandiae]